MKFFMGVEEKNRRFGGKIKEILELHVVTN